jgi:hypothetical protein
VQSTPKNQDLALRYIISSNTNQFERDDLSAMSSVMDRQVTDPRNRVSKKYSQLSQNQEKIDEIDKHLEELDSPDPSKKDVLEEATELVNDDDIISQYSAKLSVLNESKLKMIDQELQKEEQYYVQTLKASMKFIDKSKNIQVFHGPLEQPFDNLDITMQKQLGSGA